MNRNTSFFLVVAVIATVYAIWTVGFSRLWRKDAKEFLDRKFGPRRHGDEDEIEEARRDSAALWIAIAIGAWLAFGAAHRLTAP